MHVSLRALIYWWWDWWVTPTNKWWWSNWSSELFCHHHPGRDMHTVHSDIPPSHGHEFITFHVWIFFDDVFVCSCSMSISLWTISTVWWHCTLCIPSHTGKPCLSSKKLNTFSHMGTHWHCHKQMCDSNRSKHIYYYHSKFKSWNSGPFISFQGLKLMTTGTTMSIMICMFRM